MLAKRGELRPRPRAAPPGLGRRADRAGDDRASSGERLGLEIGDGYGQTETGAISRHPSRRGRPGARRLDGPAAARPRDPDRRRRAAAARRLLARPSSPATSTASRFEGEWWPTGDRVREDEDGYLWFEGRDDDLILSSGYRIGPFEVESALRLPPRGRRGGGGRRPRPRARLGGPRDRRPRATAASPPRSSPRELQEHVKAQTAPYKYPRIVEFADELPKTTSGKIKRAELRAQLG